ncbi:MAG: methyltransferase, partial [Pseudomonadota bacterium]
FTGIACETLKEVHEPIDLLFLDGWKSLYLPVFELLKPQLRPCALIAADNINFKETQTYLDVINAPDSGYVSHVIGDMALSCKT